MVSFDDICKRIFADPRWLPNFLIGGLLSFVPILNIFALGYLYRYFDQIHRGAGFGWPDWVDWEDMFLDGLRLMAIIALYGLAPVVAGWSMGNIIGIASFALVGQVAPFVFMAPLLLLAPVWVCAMLYVFQPRQRWEVLRRPHLAWLMTRAAWPMLVVPALAFWGLVLLGAALYGFVFFLGFLVLGAYYTRLFLELESRGRTGPTGG